MTTADEVFDREAFEKTVKRIARNNPKSAEFKASSGVYGNEAVTAAADLPSSLSAFSARGNARASRRRLRTSVVVLFHPDLT